MIDVQRWSTGRRALSLSLVFLVAVSALAWAVTTHEPSSVRPSTPVEIISIATPSVVTGPSTTVVVTTSANVIAVSATLYGHRVEFAADGQRWTATLHRGRELQPGVNVLPVTAVATGGESSERTIRVYQAGAPGQLGLSVRNASTAGAAAVRVAFDRPLAKLSITVNGVELPDRIDSNIRSQQVALGAGDHLRPGSNPIVVTAVDKRGGWQQQAASLTVDADAPVAEAGADDRARVGMTTTLDAGASMMHGTSQPTYSWTITQRPRGSQASVTNAATARASFLPDAPGHYEFRVAVTADGKTTADTTVRDVRAYVPPVGALLQTQAAIGSTYAIVNQGSTVVAIPQNTAGGSMLAVYDRNTLANLGSTKADASAAQVQAEVTMLNQARSNNGAERTVIAVVSVAAGNGSAVVPLLQALGVTEDANMSAGHAFSIIVATGATPSLVWRSSYQSGPGNLTGYVQLMGGGVGPFVFVPAAHLPFDTAQTSTPTSNTISIECPAGNCTWQSDSLAACSGAVDPGGFQVVVATAATLQLTANRTFTTNDGCTGASDAAADIAALTAMTALLAQYPANKDGTVDQLVIVQSIGTPRNTATATQSGDWLGVTHAWQATALALVPYGATATEFAGIGDASPQGYALFGSTALALIGSDSPYGPGVAGGNSSGAAARLTGLLTPNHRNDLAPQVTSTGGPINNAVGTAFYQPAQTWPKSSTTGEQAALAYITTTVGPNLSPGVFPASGGECYDPAHPSFRAAYCNLDIVGDWLSISKDLKALAKGPLPTIPASQTPFGASDWSDVLTELATETAQIGIAYTLLKNLESVFYADKYGGNTVDLSGIVSAVNAALQPPPDQVGSKSTFLGVISEAFGFLWALLPDPANIAMGVISEGYALGSTLTADSDGQPVLAARVDATAQALAGDLQDRYQQAAQNMSYMFDTLVTDPAKLAVAYQLGDKDGVTTTDLNASVDGLSTASQGWLYAHLFGSVFHPDPLTEGSTNAPRTPARLFQADASTFTCHSDYAAADVYQPFGSATPVQQYSALQSSPLGGQPAYVHYVLAAPGKINDYLSNKTYPALAPAAQLTQLFAPPVLGSGTKSGLGWDRTHFFERDVGLTTGTQQTCLTAPTVNGPLAAASATRDQQSVFFLNQGRIQGTTYSLSRDTWSGTPVLPGLPDTNSALAATTNGPGDLHVFFQGNGQLYNSWQDNGGAWQGPATIPGSPDSGSPLAAVSSGNGTMFLWFLSKGRLQFDNWTTAAGWQGPVTINGHPDTGSPLAAASFGPTDVHVFFLTGGKLQNMWSSNGSGWQGPGLLPGSPDRNNRSLTASTAFTAHGANVFFTAGGGAANVFDIGSGWQGPYPLTGRPANGGLAAVHNAGPTSTRWFFTTGGVLYSEFYVIGSGWAAPIPIAGPPS